MTTKAKEVFATQIRLPKRLALLFKKTAANSHRSFNAQLIFLAETALDHLGLVPQDEKGRSGMFTGIMPGERHPAERQR